MPIGAIPCCCISPDTTRFVEVPITVSVPPRMVAKLIGIRYHEAGWSRFSAQSATCGASIATIGVLFRNADAAAVGRAGAACAPPYLPLPSVAAISGCSAPVFSTARRGRRAPPR